MTITEIQTQIIFDGQREKTALIVLEEADRIALKPPLSQFELIALVGLLSHTRPENHGEYDKRYEIVRASGNEDFGLRVSDRDIALNGLFHSLREEPEFPDED